MNSLQKMYLFDLNLIEKWVLNILKFQRCGRSDTVQRYIN